MKVIALSGSPRKNGNTELLLGEIGRGLELNGNSFELIRLADLDIAPCLGCGGCSKTGECVVLDDMVQIYRKLADVSTIILSSPVYFYGLTAQAKAAVDRIQAFWCRKYILRRPEFWQDKPRGHGYLVAAAATSGPRLFEGAELCGTYFFDALGFDLAGSLYVNNVDKRGAVKGLLKELVRAHEFGRSMGQ